jgi:hypothetical protein
MTMITIPTPVYSRGIEGQHRLMMTPGRQFFWNEVEPNQVFDDINLAINYMRDRDNSIRCELPKKYRR